MTDERLAEIEARAAAATPGPWDAGGPVKRESITKVLTGGGGPNGLSREVWEVGAAGDLVPPGIAVVNRYTNGGGSWEARANAEFIAHARQDVAELIAEVRRLRAALAGE
jgi:hypothetical protein